VGITLRGPLGPRTFVFLYPAVRSLALTAAGLTTNLPLAGQSIQVRRWQSPWWCGMYENGTISHVGAVYICEGGGGQAYT
jgi:hypothetical protein